jgi:predicted DsbA family dithiol-disulfide isomerase
MSNRAPVPVVHFSDVLCIWAYCSQIRVDEIRHGFGEDVALTFRFVPVFGTSTKIEKAWATRGGFPAYAKHVRTVAERFPHVVVHPDAWDTVRPASSSSPHVFLKAVQLIEGAGPSPAGGMFERASWAVRLAFFRDARDVATRGVQLEIAEQVGVPRGQVEALLDDGRAMSAFFEDVDAQQAQKIEGSPTLVFNEGRQKLYGNVGYRVIEANIAELLRAPGEHAASWC